MLTAVRKKHSVILVRHYAANGPDMRAFEIRARETHATPIRGHRCRSSLSTRGDEPARSKTGVSRRQTGMLVRADVKGVAASGKAVIRRDRDACAAKRP